MAARWSVTVADAPAAFSETLAKKFYELTLWAIGEREVAAVAISGGSTPKPFFRRLAASPWAEKILWDRILLFWADERCVPYDSPESNYGQARSLFLSPLKLEGDQVHPWPVTGPAEACAEAYAKELRAHLPVSGDGTVVFDAVFLGIGEDGHTASLFPGAFSPGDVRPTLTTVAPGGARRLTVGPRVLRAAHHTVFAVSGAAKAPVLSRIAALPSEDPSLPASLALFGGNDVTVVADPLAAAGLG